MKAKVAVAVFPFLMILGACAQQEEPRVITTEIPTEKFDTHSGS